MSEELTAPQRKFLSEIDLFGSKITSNTNQVAAALLRKGLIVSRNLAENGWRVEWVRNPEWETQK